MPTGWLVGLVFIHPAWRARCRDNIGADGVRTARLCCRSRMRRGLPTETKGLRMRQQMVRWAWALLVCASIVGTPFVWGLTRGPQWTIGRAIIAPMRSAMSASPRLYLKLSLRNTGTPGRMPVRIYGRWASARAAGRSGAIHGAGREQAPWSGPGSAGRGTDAGGRWAMPGGGQANEESTTTAPRWGARGGIHAASSTLPPGVRLLGSYRREVSLSQTTILEVPLTVLGVPARGTTQLEVVVMTASVITDHQFVALGAS